MFVLHASTAGKFVKRSFVLYGSGVPRVTDEHRQERRAQLLDAARRCFVRQGFHATSMKDVLAEAGMSAGAAYGYFSSKDEIILAVAEENMGQVAATLRAVLAAEGEHTPATALAQVLELIRFQNANNDFAKVAVIVWSEAIRNPVLRARLSALGKQYRKTFGKLSSTGRPHQRAADRSVGATATAIVTGYILQLALDEPITVKELAEPIHALWQPPNRSPGSTSTR